MRLERLDLSGLGVWPRFRLDAANPQLNVFFGETRSGKSVLAHLVAHLLYGNASGHSNGLSSSAEALPEGSVQVASREGRFALRRHRDGSRDGRLTIAAEDGSAADNRTIRRLLCDHSPQLLGRLMAVDFASSPSPLELLDREFAQQFNPGASTAPSEAAESRDEGRSGDACDRHAGRDPSPAIDRRQIDQLVATRDDVAHQIEEALRNTRQESVQADRQLRQIESAQSDVRQDLERAQGGLRGVEAELGKLETELRYFALESFARRGLQVDADQRQEDLANLDGEIAQCRTMIGDLQHRESVVRRELAQSQPDGIADSAGCLADQRATIG
ncbi:MAG: AAA family ATPase, partial [Planctomycetota bacterium]